MKKGIISKLGAGAVVLTLVTASLVGGTFAKYTNTVEGSASGAIAKFSFTSTNLKATTPIELNEGRKLAPGTKGSIEIAVSSDSDVNVEYSINLDTLAGAPDGLVFSATEGGTAITIPADAVTPVEFVKDTIDAGTVVPQKVVLFWSWDYNSADVAEMAPGQEVTFNISAVGTQVAPTPAP